MNKSILNQPRNYADLSETKYGLLVKRSRIGGRKENQDFAGYAETQNGLLIVVCDGMGGANGGKTASELAIRNIIEQVSMSQYTNADEILIHAIKVANQVVYQAGLAVPELRGMGTTVTALLIDDKKATAAHVGDSRIYQIRNGNKVFRTFDHSMVFELVKRKSLTEEQARLSAESNIILRALGTKPDIEVEINTNLTYEKGDRYFLCTDGICGAIIEKVLIKLLKGDKLVEDTIENIVSYIDKVGITNGGNHDNLTGALIEINKNSKLKPKMEKKSKIIIGILLIIVAISIAGNILQRYLIEQNIEQIVTPNDSLSRIFTDSISVLNDSIKRKDSALVSIKENTEKQSNKYLNLISKKTDSIAILKKEIIQPKKQVFKDKSSSNPPQK